LIVDGIRLLAAKVSSSLFAKCKHDEIICEFCVSVSFCVTVAKRFCCENGLEFFFNVFLLNLTESRSRVGYSIVRLFLHTDVDIIHVEYVFSDISGLKLCCTS